MDLKIHENVGIKFKEFVYIYNFTCFKLIQMDLKSHGKCRNQKNFLRVCLVTVFFFFLIFCFQKQFSIFETKNLVWRSKMDRKQKLFSKLIL